jgi:hypothetical protein
MAKQIVVVGSRGIALEFIDSPLIQEEVREL